MELHTLEEMAEALTMPETPMPPSVFPAVTPPGMAYVPYQQWGEVYDAQQGHCCGTMFPVLHLPFDRMGGDCGK